MSTELSTKHWAQNAQTIAINTATNVPGLFGIGNAAALYPISPAAAYTNLTMSGICFTSQLISECYKAGINIPAPKIIKKFAQSSGASFAVCSLFNLTAAAFAAQNIEWDQLETIKETAMSTAFGLAPLSWAGAAYAKENGATQKILNSAGTVIAVTGLYIANPDPSITTTALYVAGAGSAITLIAKSENAHGLIQPDLIVATGITSNITPDTPENMITANIIWAGAYLSLDAVKKKGGIAESCKDLTEKIKYVGNKLTNTINRFPALTTAIIHDAPRMWMG